MITEKEFMRQVLELARHRGWLCYHTFDSRRSVAGFPDLILLKGPRMLAVELKRSSKQKPTPEQQRWLGAFLEAGVEVGLWTPECWDLIEAVLEDKYDRVRPSKD